MPCVAKDTKDHRTCQHPSNIAKESFGEAPRYTRAPDSQDLTVMSDKLEHGQKGLGTLAPMHHHKTIVSH